MGWGGEGCADHPPVTGKQTACSLLPGTAPLISKVSFQDYVAHTSREILNTPCDDLKFGVARTGRSWDWNFKSDGFGSQKFDGKKKKSPPGI